MRIWKISRTNEAAGVKQPDLPGEPVKFSKSILTFERAKSIIMDTDGRYRTYGKDGKTKIG